MKCEYTIIKHSWQMDLGSACCVNQGLNDAVIWFWVGIWQRLFKISRVTNIQSVERAGQKWAKELNLEPHFGHPCADTADRLVEKGEKWWNKPKITKNQEQITVKKNWAYLICRQYIKQGVTLLYKAKSRSTYRHTHTNHDSLTLHWLFVRLDSKSSIIFLTYWST